jgi:hypothetical protein
MSASRAVILSRAKNLTVRPFVSLRVTDKCANLMCFDLAQNYITARPLIVVGAFVTVVAIGLGIIWVNRIAFRRMRRLREL